MTMIRLLIVEDQTLMREGLKTILDLEPGMTVVGEASNGVEGVAEALRLKPEVVLMDVQMPELDGVAATEQICAAWPGARIIVLTTFSRDDLVFKAIRAGALGFLLKDAPAQVLADTIRRVHNGDVFIQPEIASRALLSAAQPADAVDELSPRELDVLRLLAAGHANKEIGSRLSIGEGTVKNHVSNILVKLQASNRTHAAEIARRRGLVDG